MLFTAVDLNVTEEDEEMVDLIASRMKPVIRGKNSAFEAVIRCVVVGLQALAVLESLDPEGKKRLILAAIYKAMDETKSPLDKFEEILKPVIAEVIDSLLETDAGTLKFRKKPRRYLWKKWCCCGCAEVKTPPSALETPPAPAPLVLSPPPSPLPMTPPPVPEIKPVAPPQTLLSKHRSKLIDNRPNTDGAADDASDDGKDDTGGVGVVVDDDDGIPI